MKMKLEPVPGTEFKYEEYKMGRVSTGQIGKKLLVGAAGGFVLPFMGFGQIPSILSGIYAAESIVKGKDYNRLAAWFKKRYESSLILRNYANTLDNGGLDRLVSFFSQPVVSNLTANSNLPVLGIAAKAVVSRNLIKGNTAKKR